MAGYRENKEFKDDIFGNILDDAINWIQSNLQPEDVFDEEKLKDWAEDNGYVKSEDWLYI